MSDADDVEMKIGDSGAGTQSGGLKGLITDDGGIGYRVAFMPSADGDRDDPERYVSNKLTEMEVSYGKKTGVAHVGDDVLGYEYDEIDSETYTRGTDLFSGQDWDTYSGAVAVDTPLPITRKGGVGGAIDRMVGGDAPSYVVDVTARDSDGNELHAQAEISGNDGDSGDRLRDALGVGSLKDIDLAGDGYDPDDDGGLFSRATGLVDGDDDGMLDELIAAGVADRAFTYLDGRGSSA